MASSKALNRFLGNRIRRHCQREAILFQPQLCALDETVSFWEAGNGD